MKNKRQEAILEIISQQSVETQEELLALLRARGILATQSTVSRDIKQLHLIKEPWNGKSYRYTTSKKNTEYDAAGRLQKIMSECCLRCDYAQNLIILKTMPGLGAAAGSAIDAMERPDKLGCVSGDDTVLVIMRDEAGALELCREIHLMCR